MRIDFHTHAFPESVVFGRERFFDGEPEFRSLYDTPQARLATAEELVRAMDQSGVDRSVVFGFPWRNTELAARHNDYVLDAAARHFPRLVPFGCVNPLAPGALKEVERCLASGAPGIGETATYGPCDPQELLGRYGEIAACCRSAGGILLVHANEPVGRIYPGKASLGPEFFYSLASVAQGIPLVLAHWGGGLFFYELLKKEAPEILAGVFYDTAASPFLYRSEIYVHATQILGPEKILFGSDFPLLPPERYLKEMADAGLDPDALRRITGGNAARLLGVEGEE